jgi:Flp pilus assembly protein protease CpaA
MYEPFFPTLEFAWGFLALLTGILAAASYVDHQRMIIPKRVTLTLLAAGFVASIVRGAWLGSEGGQLWICGTGNLWLGGLDGFLFALIGGLVGFALLFVLWILGSCGGGDVKLFTALGAWLGPLYTLYVLFVSLGVLSVFVLFKLVSGSITLKTMQQSREWQKQKAQSKEQPLKKPPKWRISYSLPVTIATVLVLSWIFRAELHLTFLGPQKGGAIAHAR